MCSTECSRQVVEVDSDRDRMMVDVSSSISLVVGLQNRISLIFVFGIRPAKRCAVAQRTKGWH